MAVPIIFTGIEINKKAKQKENYNILLWGGVIAFLILALTIRQDKMDELEFNEQKLKTATANLKASDNEQSVQILKIKNNKLIQDSKLIEERIANSQKQRDSMRLELSNSLIQQKMLEIKARKLEITNKEEKAKRHLNEISTSPNRRIQINPTITNLKKHSDINVIVAIFDHGEAIATANSLISMFNWNDWNVANSFNYFEDEYLQRIPKSDERSKNEMKLDYVHHYPQKGIRIYAYGKARFAAEDLKHHLLATGVFAIIDDRFFYASNFLNISENTIYLIVDKKPYNSKQLLEEIYLRNEIVASFRDDFLSSKKIEYLNLFKMEKDIIIQSIDSLRKAGYSDEKIYEILEKYNGMKFKRNNLNIDLIVKQILAKRYPYL